jgi:hypothetical protein
VGTNTAFDQMVLLLNKILIGIRAKRRTSYIDAIGAIVSIKNNTFTRAV